MFSCDEAIIAKDGIANKHDQCDDCLNDSAKYKPKTLISSTQSQMTIDVGNYGTTYTQVELYRDQEMPSRLRFVSIGDSVNKLVAVAMVKDTTAWAEQPFASLTDLNFVSDVFRVQRFGDGCSYPSTCDDLTLELYLPDLPDGSFVNVQLQYHSSGTIKTIDTVSKRGSGWWFVTIPGGDCSTDNSHDIYLIASEAADPCVDYGCDTATTTCDSSSGQAVCNCNPAHGRVDERVCKPIEWTCQDLTVRIENDQDLSEGWRIRGIKLFTGDDDNCEQSIDGSDFTVTSSATFARHNANAVLEHQQGVYQSFADGDKDWKNNEWWSACQDGCAKGSAWIEITVPAAAIANYGCTISSVKISQDVVQFSEVMRVSVGLSTGNHALYPGHGFRPYITSQFVKQWVIGTAGETCTKDTHPRPDPSKCHVLDIGTKDKSVAGAELASYDSVPSAFQCRLLALQHVDLGVRSWKWFSHDDNTHIREQADVAWHLVDLEADDLLTTSGRGKPLSKLADDEFTIVDGKLTVNSDSELLSRYRGWRVMHPNKQDALTKVDDFVSQYGAKSAADFIHSSFHVKSPQPHVHNQICYLMGSSLDSDALPADQTAYWTVGDLGLIVTDVSPGAVVSGDKFGLSLHGVGLPTSGALQRIKIVPETGNCLDMHSSLIMGIGCSTAHICSPKPSTSIESEATWSKLSARSTRLSANYKVCYCSGPCYAQGDYVEVTTGTSPAIFTVATSEYSWSINSDANLETTDDTLTRNSGAFNFMLNRISVSNPTDAMNYQVEQLSNVDVVDRC